MSHENLHFLNAPQIKNRQTNEDKIDPKGKRDL